MNIGEKIQLSKGEFKIIACKICWEPMVDLTNDQIGIGDLLKLKLHSIKLSNPDHKKAICIPCEIEQNHPKLQEYVAWTSSSSNDDSGFFSGGSSGDDSSSSVSSGGFSMPNFGGFGGGGFDGGGASGGF